MKNGNPFFHQIIMKFIQKDNQTTSSSIPEKKFYPLPQHIRSWITGEGLQKGAGTRSSQMLSNGSQKATRRSVFSLHTRRTSVATNASVRSANTNTTTVAAMTAAVNNFNESTTNNHSKNNAVTSRHHQKGSEKSIALPSSQPVPLEVVPQDTKGEEEEEDDDEGEEIDEQELGGTDWMSNYLLRQKELIHSLNATIKETIYERIILNLSTFIMMKDRSNYRRSFNQLTRQSSRHMRGSGRFNGDGNSENTSQRSLSNSPGGPPSLQQQQQFNKERDFEKQLEHLETLNENCEELLIFGGITKILSLTRLMEDIHIPSTRGIIVIEEFYAQSFNSLKTSNELVSSYPSLITSRPLQVSIMPLGGLNTPSQSFSLNASFSSAAANGVVNGSGGLPALQQDSFFTQPLYSYLKQSLTPTSYYYYQKILNNTVSFIDVVHHPQFASFLRAGFLHFANQDHQSSYFHSFNPLQSIRRMTSMQGKMVQDMLISKRNNHSRNNSNLDDNNSMTKFSSSSLEIENMNFMNLLSSNDGKKLFLFILFMKIRYKNLCLENNWMIWRGISRCQAIVRGRALRKKRGIIVKKIWLSLQKAAITTTSSTSSTKK
jgi:hypothetical protein